MTNFIRSGGVVLLLGLILVSCQKELQFEEGESEKGLRIIRAVSVTGTDTLVSEYKYDQRLRLESETSTGKLSGDPYYSFTGFSWDHQDRITELLHKTWDDNETIHTTVHYPDASAKEYDYLISTQIYHGALIQDSTAFVFDNGNMVKNESFRLSGNQGYLLSRRETFRYNTSGNVDSTDTYSSIGSVNGYVVLISTSCFTYADHADYLWTTDNAAQNYLLIGIPNRNHKSVKELNIIDRTGLSPTDFNISTTLVTDSTGIPQTGTRYMFPQNTTSDLTFYYQQY